MHLQPYGVQRWGAPADFCLQVSLKRLIQPFIGDVLACRPLQQTDTLDGNPLKGYLVRAEEESSLSASIVTLAGRHGL